MTNQEGYTLTNGETYSPFRDDSEFNSKIRSIRTYYAQWSVSSKTVRSSDESFVAALNRIFDQSIVAIAPKLLSPEQAEVDEDIWQAFDRVLSDFPDDVLSDLPKDLSINHDHYLYDTQKKS